jgi:hypothetical protein
VARVQRVGQSAQPAQIARSPTVVSRVRRPKTDDSFHLPQEAFTNPESERRLRQSALYEVTNRLPKLCQLVILLHLRKVPLLDFQDLNGSGETLARRKA